MSSSSASSATVLLDKPRTRKPTPLAQIPLAPVAVRQAKPEVVHKTTADTSTIALALQSANAIATNRTHPNQSQVSELINTYEKGWITPGKFVEILKTLMF
mmetsp:Transcript_29553/g.42202  ORF Transcript_29553/g.42202 Transcript_29553/m.42202 type:complete len:101 (+) Transcript_29553:203-505(+)